MVHQMLIEGMKEDLAVVGKKLDEIEGTPLYNQVEKELRDCRETVAALRERLE